MSIPALWLVDSPIKKQQETNKAQMSISSEHISDVTFLEWNTTQQSKTRPTWTHLTSSRVSRCKKNKNNLLSPSPMTKELEDGSKIKITGCSCRAPRLILFTNMVAQKTFEFPVPDLRLSFGLHGLLACIGYVDKHRGKNTHIHKTK